MTASQPSHAALPRFDVAISPPDISPWIEGNTGVPGFTTVDSGQPGPHVGLIALTHGNELPGAIVLDRMLRHGLRPARGKLTLGFANIRAFLAFDPTHPTASRFVDEDMNRVWDDAVLAANRHSYELDRARQMRPIIERFDMLLDLHSMLWPSEPLLLCGSAAKGRRLADSLGLAPLIVADAGHAGGRRLIDAARFTDPDCAGAAVLLESGQHWQPDSVAMTEAAIAGLLRHAGLAPPASAPSSRTPGRFAQVTRVITATTANFNFVRPYRGGDIVHAADTLIAMDGNLEIRTPHDDCLLIMPSLRPSRGHTAVRLARATRPARSA